MGLVSDGKSLGEILLVEDDARNYELLSDHLVTAGFSVRGANNGSQALDLALEYSPDVVVADYDVPGMDGCQLARRLRDDPRTVTTRVLLITGHVQQRMREIAINAGCDGFLAKPFRLDSLVGEIRRLLEAPHQTAPTSA